MYDVFPVATVALTSGEIWYRKIKDSIQRAQETPIWMSEMKVDEENYKEDYLFPMSNRLSYASSPESDNEFGWPAANGPEPKDNSPPLPRKKLVRSSSDPSVATAENIPGIPPYPDPPSYPREHRDQTQVRWHQNIKVWVLIVDN